LISLWSCDLPILFTSHN